jgi:hypothetical protein
VGSNPTSTASDLGRCVCAWLSLPQRSPRLSQFLVSVTDCWHSRRRSEPWLLCLVTEIAGPSVWRCARSQTVRLGVHQTAASRDAGTCGLPAPPRGAPTVAEVAKSPCPIPAVDAGVSSGQDSQRYGWLSVRDRSELAEPGAVPLRAGARGPRLAGRPERQRLQAGRRGVRRARGEGLRRRGPPHETSCRSAGQKAT